MTNEQDQPTAGGAEEILVRNLGSLMPLKYGVIYNKTIDAMTELAALHAQQMAEKMVSDMRQKLFSMRATKKAMDKLSEADRLMMYGYHDCINEMLMWTKSRER